MVLKKISSLHGKLTAIGKIKLGLASGITTFADFFFIRLQEQGFKKEMRMILVMNNNRDEDNK